ncbi:MAG: sugar nucleotide-binding protein [Candidatus Omnitrophota bacterium]|nr:MAG: sugar nucleotide-binding protein [Candidatus Omnitrophota bacterium]
MKKDRILLFGKGFIGEKVAKAFDCDVSTRILSSFKDAEAEIKKYKPKTIINCIGYTGKRNVDDCELDKDNTLYANTFIPIILADLAIRNNIKLIHISSGCIYKFRYGKDKPISEDKIPDSYDLFYSRSKIYTERSLGVFADKFNLLLARIRIPLDNRPHPKNILNKLIKYKTVINVPNSVTYIPDFLKALKHLMKINAKGIYNVVNKGPLRYPQLLDVYKKYRPDFKYTIIKNKDLKLMRTNLVLSTRKLEKTGFKVRKISEVLEECVKDYLKY